MAESLADKITKRIGDIGAVNPGYITPIQQTLKQTLSESMLRRIALEAADVARQHFVQEE